eukprot:gene4494-7874_t
MNFFVDIGSENTQAGNLHNETATIFQKSIIGSPRHPSILFSNNLKDMYVSQEACSKRGILKITYPVRDGIIEDFNGYENILKDVFSQLSTNEKNISLIQNENIGNTEIHRQTNSQILFEKFSIENLYSIPSEVLTLYGTGRVNGLAVSIGASRPNIIPIYDGYPLIEQYIVFELIFPGNELFESVEPLFKPNMIDKNSIAIHESVEKSISNCPKFIQKELLSNVVLHGRSTLFPNFDVRLSQEMSKKSDVNVHQFDPNDTFSGAKILTSALDESKGWFNIKDYNEYGASYCGLHHGTNHPKYRYENTTSDVWISPKDFLFEFIKTNNEIMSRTSKIYNKLEDLNFIF